MVVGDFGTGSSAEAGVAAAMEKAALAEHVDWLITTGDNFYSDDVDAIWSRPFGWVEAAGIRVIAALGNHDLETATRRMLVAESLGVDQPWYRVDVGSAVVLVLDANRPEDGQQLDWLAGQLDRLDHQLVITVFHQPAFSCSLHGSTAPVVERWVPLFEAHDVDLVLNGHDHNYQRHLRAGISYVVTGGGGAGLYAVGGCPAGTDPPLASDDVLHHFLVLSILPRSVAVEARGTDGAILDLFTVEERIKRPNQAREAVGVSQHSGEGAASGDPAPD
jgi:predicted phosphodiesterase